MLLTFSNSINQLHPTTRCFEFPAQINFIWISLILSVGRSMRCLNLLFHLLLLFLPWSLITISSCDVHHNYTPYPLTVAHVDQANLSLCLRYVSCEERKTKLPFSGNGLIYFGIFAFHLNFMFSFSRSFKFEFN